VGVRRGRATVFRGLRRSCAPIRRGPGPGRSSVRNSAIATCRRGRSIPGKVALPHSHPHHLEAPPATPWEWLRIARLSLVVIALHVVGFGLLIGESGAQAGFVATGTLAYTLGLRHAFDADHIAAIDNTTRKLRQDGQQPLSIGLYFSLGHSAVVLVLALVVALVTHAVPDISGSTGFVGASVSGAFLWTVGLLNLVVLLDVLKVARRVRAGDHDEQLLEQMLVPKGMLMRLGLDRVMRFVRKPWQMLPIGLLFGLGFDTATEVAVLTIGAGATAQGLPLPAVLAIPILFAAGMSMMDTADGIVMARAYDWALHRPARKIFYNLTITSLSVIVALVIGSVQLINVAIQALDLRGGAWDWIGGLDFQVLGYVMAGLFVGTWLLALVLWRVLRIEERWTPATVERAPVV
jgi:high-affinity nickel-transport protein